MQTEQILYELVDLQRYYLQKAEIVKAIDGITLDIKTGDFIAIVGPSGSGKTTLLNLLAGLDGPTSGQISFSGQDFSKLDDSQLCNIRRYNIGIVFQFYNMHPAFTAQENVEYPLMISDIPLKQRRERAYELLAMFGLESKKDNLPSELSGGEKQRVGIARALANNPEVIIADEPTGDLDSENAEKIIGLLLNINKNQKKTIVMVTHDEELLSPEMIQINLVDGKIV